MATIPDTKERPSKSDFNSEKCRQMRETFEPQDNFCHSYGSCKSANKLLYFYFGLSSFELGLTTAAKRMETIPRKCLESY